MNRFTRLCLVLLAGAWSCFAAPREELEALSLDELLALHTDSEAEADRPVLRELLRERLKGLSEGELQGILENLDIGGPYVEAGTFTICEMIARDTVVVQAKVESTEEPVEVLIRNILDLDDNARVKRITLRVTEQYPPEPAVDHLTFDERTFNECHWFATWGGNEGLFVLKPRNGRLEAVSPSEAFRIRDGSVCDVVTRWTPMPIDVAWEAIRFQTDLSRGSVGPDDYTTWRAKLHSDDPAVCAAALELLLGLPDPQLDPNTLMDDLERLYGVIRAEVPSGDDTWELPAPAERARVAFDAYAERVCEALEAKPEAVAVQRLVNLYKRDVRENGRPIVTEISNRIVPLLAASDLSDRAAQIELLFSERWTVADEEGPQERGYFRFPLAVEFFRDIPEVFGSDIEQVFLEIAKDPSRIGARDAYDIYCVWKLLAERGRLSIRVWLEHIAFAKVSELPKSLRSLENADEAPERAQWALAKLTRSMPDDDALPLLLRIARTGSADDTVQEELARRVTPGSPAGLDFLKEVDAGEYADVIAQKFPDPMFVPKLKAAAGKEPSLEVLQALYACGETETAVSLAVEALKDFEAGGEQNDEFPLSQLLEFLGDTGHPSAAEPLQSVIEDKCRQLEVRGFKDGPPMEISQFSRDLYTIDCLRTAMLALANVEGEAALPLFKRLYEEGIPHIQFVAGWILYAVGDDTGATEVQQYREGALSDYAYLGVALTSVRSERTDNAILEHLRNGYKLDDIYTLVCPERLPSSPPRRFLESHQREILSTLAGQLEKSSLAERYEVNRVMKEMIGQEPYPMTGGASSMRRYHIVQEWRDYLAKGTDVAPMTPVPE